MERRAFLQWVGVGSLASFLPIALAACNSGADSDSDSAASPPAATAPPAATPAAGGASPPEGFEAAGTTAQLQQSGQLSLTVGNAKAIVLRDPTSNNLVAVNTTCPHRGCEVAWKASASEFVCPCHQAKFRANGEVIEGPAESPLATYQVKREGDSIFVQKS